jgi:AcrR family transcriptional regulator
MKSTRPPTKHQIKSDATRIALLQAAAKIFARDGFERAQIDEIAKESGRTRGAVYAQYKTKEQLFFALQSQRIEQASKDFEAFVADVAEKDKEIRLKRLKSYYSGQMHEEAAILDLEMKLYALRNPDSVESMREYYRQLYPKGDLAKPFGLKKGAGRSAISSRVLAMGAVKSGLILAMRFQPDLLPAKELQCLLGEIFDGLFPIDSASDKPAERTKRGTRAR